MTQYSFINILFLSALAVMVRAQSFEEKPKILPKDYQKMDFPKTDSLTADFEEWLRNEPLRPESSKELFTKPLPHSTAIIEPRLLHPKHPPVTCVIMTPKLRTDMILAYHSHWLEEQRKAQQGGAMMVGFSPLCLISVGISYLFPELANKKTKKERQREHLKRVLEHY